VIRVKDTVKYYWKFFTGVAFLLTGFFITACQVVPDTSASNPVSSSVSSQSEIEHAPEQNEPAKTKSLTPVFTETKIVDSTENADTATTPAQVSSPTLTANPLTGVLADCKATGNPSFEEETLTLVNQEREKKSLPPLVLNDLLVAAARAHSADMACRNYFSHQGLDGSTSFKRMEASGYQMAYAGENIYAGPEQYNTPAQAVRHWMNSSSHRASILNPNYTEAGVGYYFSKPATYDGYFTIDFASPAVIDAQSEGN
jgi:uncharacterized protein YkwD